MKVKLVFVLVIVGQIAFAQSRIQKVDSLINLLYKNGKFNGNILIAEKGKIVYNKSFGIANESTKENLKASSVFELASCSKQFTAMGIIILKEKGRLNLDDKLAKFIPELSYLGDITIRSLLIHTSGLPDYLPIMDSLWNKNKIATNHDIIQMFSSHKPKLLFVPNTKHEYSNTGYAFLATIIEKVSGLTYGEFLKRYVFKPVKMRNSFVYNRRLSPQKIDNYALGYLYIKSQNKYILPDDYEKTKMVYWLDGIVGDGTVNSTVIDLLKWDRALYSTKLVSKESIFEIFTNGVLNDKTQGKHGFGWRVLETKEYGKIARHSGGWPGYNTYIERNIDNDKTIIVLQNHSNVTTPSDEIRNILYEPIK